MAVFSGDQAELRAALPRLALRRRGRGQAHDVGSRGLAGTAATRGSRPRGRRAAGIRHRVPAQRARGRRVGVPPRLDGATSHRACVPRCTGGVTVLTAEIVLPYKAKAPRGLDHRDFHAALPLLDPEARPWLRAALPRATRRHSWEAARERVRGELTARPAPGLAQPRRSGPRAAPALRRKASHWRTSAPVSTVIRRSGRAMPRPDNAQPLRWT